MAGLTKNKAKSAQLGLAGALAELGNIVNIIRYCQVFTNTE